jgi:hypothetical protein
MKRFVALALIGIALAVIASSFVRRGCCDKQLAKSAGCGDTSRWFRCEFGADGPTCDAIVKAQADFCKKCREHCAATAAAGEILKQLPADAPKESREAAEASLEAAKKHCHEARVAHARRIAGMLAPEAGKRYLTVVLPHLAKLDHAGPPDAACNR